MKKITMLMAVLAILGTNTTFAQSNNSNMGKGAAAGSNTGSNGGMAWAVGLGSLAVLATVAGITAASASSDPSTYSH